MISPALSEFTLPESDVRRIVRLLGGVIASAGGIHQKRRMLMDGLCHIVRATSWAWCMAEFDPDKPPSFIGFEHGGWDEQRFGHYIEAMNHPDMNDVTRSLRPMDPAMLLENSNAGAFWTRANIGTLLIYQRPMEGGGISGVAVYREMGESHFDERETKIAHIVLSEVPWLHFTAFPDQKSQDITRLYPRHRTVLNLLGDGWSRKKIAVHLGISENTVHGYVKVIFKHFGVHSHSELLTRFSKGGGGEL